MKEQKRVIRYEPGQRRLIPMSSVCFPGETS